MKTNSKLTKRVLAIALAVCMLCSVLVAGIGTGIVAKAETETKTYTSTWDNTWQDSGAGYYTHGYGFSTDLSEYTWTGTETITATFTASGIPEGGNYTGSLWFFTPDWASASNSVSVTADGTYTITGNAANLTGKTGVGTQQVEIYDANSTEASALDGVALSNVTLKIEGIAVETEEDITASDTDTSNTDASESDTPAPVAPYTANMSYGSKDWATAGWGVDGQTIDGPGTYTFSWDGNGDVTWLLVVELAGLAEAPSDIKPSKAVVYCDGEEIYEGGVFEGVDGANYRYTLFNTWGNKAFAEDAAAFNSNIKVELTFVGIDEEAEYDTPSAPAEDDKEDVVVKPHVKENDYVHDKGAIFVYTGNKYDIHDFSFMAGWCFAAVHEEKGEWGAYYEDFADMRGDGIYIKYWEDYRGIGYPAIQLSWDTDRIYYFSLTLHSDDWAFQKTYGEEGFYRGPEERYAGTGEKLLDGSNRWYYFTEGSYAGADTTTEETPVEDTTTEAPANAGTVNVTGDGEYYAFVAIGADNVANDWAYSWAGDEAAPVAGITANAVKAKLGEQFTISAAFDTPVYYTWYVSPTIIAGAGKTAVDFTIDDIRLDGKSVMNTIDFEADGVQWWYEGTGNYTVDEAIRLYGGYNEWGTKYFTESPAGYSLIEYDITINSIA